MTNFNAIPVSPLEDQAFNELSTAIDRAGCRRHHQDPGGPIPPVTSLAGANLLPTTKEPRPGSATGAGLKTPGVNQVSRRKLSESTVVPVLGIWLLYAYMFAWALEAVK